MWLLCELNLITLPDPVTLNRLAAPLWDFIFAMTNTPPNSLLPWIELVKLPLFGYLFLGLVLRSFGDLQVLADVRPWQYPAIESLTCSVWSWPNQNGQSLCRENEPRL